MERVLFLIAQLVLFGAFIGNAFDSVDMWIFDQYLGFMILWLVFGLFGLRYQIEIMSQSESWAEAGKIMFHEVSFFTKIFGVIFLLYGVYAIGIASLPEPTGLSQVVIGLYFFVSDLRKISAQDVELPDEQTGNPLALSAEEVGQMSQEDWAELDS